jgi:hypothetical protein
MEEAMTTYTILRQKPGQAIPRPFNRASSVGEAAEMLACVTMVGTANRALRQKLSAIANENPAAILLEKNIGTDSPVFHWGDDRFYMFAEA